MENYLNLTLSNRAQQCYVRQVYDGNTVQTFFAYKAVHMDFAKRPGTTTHITDRYAERLCENGLITPVQLADYYAHICAEYHFKDCHMDQSQADIYAFICRSRAAFFGSAALAAGRALQKENAPVFEPSAGIDQRAKKQELLEKAQAVIFLLTQPELFAQMARDLENAQKLGKSIYVCVGADGDMPDQTQLESWLHTDNITWLPANIDGIAKNDTLQEAIDKGAACLLFYGEEGLLHCRGLALDTIVTAKPMGYHAQALCNQLGDPRDNVIYIPKGLDITPCVPIIAQTRLTYYHLAKLHRRYGDSIYSDTPKALYEKYPSAFVNIYDTSHREMPLSVSAENFDESKDRAVADYLNGFSNIRYSAAYFDENLTRQPICYDPAKPQAGILVHALRVKKSKGARVMECPKGVTPRKVLADEGFSAPALVTNFLFFMTPKLGVLYNDLRSDRPFEQADASAGHLDYKLCWENGVRKETFPLFKKCCVAQTEDGEFHFFNYRLGGGSVQLGAHNFRWEAADVDQDNPGDICVYTPFGTVHLADADRETYRLPVGQGRVNAVILQDRIVCLRKGDVLLPGAGVVLSLTEKLAKNLLCDLQPLQDGYFDVQNLSLQVVLDGPADLPKDTWQKVQWAYGGGLSMILDGVSMLDGGDMLSWFAREGWLSPLSRQTQESVYHKSVKHPRTAMGMAENGDLLLLVISGRTWRSTGANYEEIIGIARALFPDIKTLMNMDGGGSAVLGLARNGSFMELSCPATSTGSCVGMVRPINTMLYIPAEEGAK